MPALDTADVKVVVERRVLAAGQYRASGTITVGDGIKTYPTGGIKLPVPSAFGMPHVIDSLQTAGSVGVPPPNVTPPALTVGADGRYVLQLLKPGTGTMDEVANTVVPATQTYRFIAMGS
jgi:hypothetical protein